MSDTFTPFDLLKYNLWTVVIHQTMLTLKLTKRSLHKIYPLEFRHCPNKGGRGINTIPKGFEVVLF